MRRIMSKPPVKFTRLVLLTALSPNVKYKCERILRKIPGGKMAGGVTWAPGTTHLIVGRLSRTEKILSAIASGVW
jgi:hypothetical protein